MNNFLHAYAIGPITIPQQSPSLCTNLYISVSQDQESAINKSRPNNIFTIAACVCEKKVHECSCVHYPDYVSCTQWRRGPLGH